MLRQVTVIHEPCDCETSQSRMIYLSFGLLARRVTDLDAFLPEVHRLHAASVLNPSMKIMCLHVLECKRLNLARQIANSIHFHFNSFTYSLTLFSKSYSSFSHGTCSQLVSFLYLALGGVYHRFWAVIPKNRTLEKHISEDQTFPCMGLLPFMMCCCKQLR